MKLLMMCLAGLVTLLVWTPSASAGDLDCADFATQAEAQQHLTPGDPHGLDAEGDGVACESLPCPCSTDTGGSDGGGGDGGGEKPKPPKVLKFSARVTHVVDGNTIDVRSYENHKHYRIRLLGLKVPNLHGNTQCGAVEARSLMKELARGRVKVKTDRRKPKKNSNGRLLAYVSHGSDLGHEMIGKGRARVQGRGFSRYRHYKRAEIKARRNDRGSWSDCRNF